MFQQQFLRGSSSSSGTSSGNFVDADKLDLFSDKPRLLINAPSTSLGGVCRAQRRVMLHKKAPQAVVRRPGSLCRASAYASKGGSPSSCSSG
jgi:hypothetical protein